MFRATRVCLRLLPTGLIDKLNTIVRRLISAELRPMLFNFFHIPGKSAFQFIASLRFPMPYGLLGCLVLVALGLHQAQNARQQTSGPLSISVLGSTPLLTTSPTPTPPPQCGL